MTPEQRLAKQARDRAYRARKHAKAEETLALALAETERRRQHKIAKDRRYRQRKREKRQADLPAPLLVNRNKGKKLTAGQLLPGSLNDPSRWQSMTLAEYKHMSEKSTRPVTGSGLIGQFSRRVQSQ